MVATTPYSPTKLVQLRQTKALSFEYNHNSCIRNIHSYLDNSCGNEDLSLPFYKSIHFLFLLFRLHFAVHLTHFEVRKHLFQVLKARFQALQVRLFAFLNQWKNNVNLPSLRHLFAYSVVKRSRLSVVFMNGFDGFSTWWQFIYHANVEISVYSHRQSTWNRRCSHHQNMRRLCAFCPHFSPLSHSKTMLFVYHSHA